jgi:benzoyl-CoA reductase/2-hydroxyglutaryl-CoA dehydratase subunit BcrC/BadD/HgdB
MFEPFERMYRERHDYARAWKERTGGKLLGYFCTYVPEEILYAADVLPASRTSSACTVPSAATAWRRASRGTSTTWMV